MPLTHHLTRARSRARAAGRGLVALALAGSLTLGGAHGAGAWPYPEPTEPLYPDLTLALADAPDPVAAGGTLTYTLTVGNDGDLRATGVAVRQTLPSGAAYQSASATGGFTCAQAAGVVTCTGGALDPGATATITTRVTAPGAAATLATSAAVDPDRRIREWDEANNSAGATTTVLAPPPEPARVDLTIGSLSDAPDPVYRGGDVTYTFRVVNAGPDTATGVFALLSSQGTYQYVSISSPDGWSCVPHPEYFSLHVYCFGGSVTGGATLGPGQGATVSVTARAPGVTAVQTVTATVDFSNRVAETNESNNSLSITTAVQ
jgi:uncharacterized repeat protein (TIGR01451 family)